MKRIGLIDVDGHSSFPNFALMRISAYFKNLGHHVEWASEDVHYDSIWASKVFTFTKDVDWNHYSADEIHKGGTGYDIQGRLPGEIESSLLMDYTIYPDFGASIQFFSRGCIRKCPFCLVSKKEGHIMPVEPVQLNPIGTHIEVLDNNFFANPKWRDAVKYILDSGQPVKLHGVDVRIMDEEQAEALNSMKHVGRIHIAWDLPQLDLRPQLEALTKRVKAYKITCYVLVGFNSTIEQDIERCVTLKSFGISPFVQPFRDYENERVPRQYEKDLARWANNKILFKSTDFLNFEPRKGFLCGEYLKHRELMNIPSRLDIKRLNQIAASKLQKTLF